MSENICINEKCSRPVKRGFCCPTCTIVSTIMVMVKSNYDPSDLPQLAKDLESGTVFEIIQKCKDHNIFMLRRIVTMIERLCTTEEQDPEYIKRGVARHCRKTAEFQDELQREVQAKGRCEYTAKLGEAMQYIRREVSKMKV